MADTLLAAQHASSGTRMTPRERDVPALMATGLSNSSIAQRLHLSLSSVEKHVTAISTALHLAQPEPATHLRVTAVLRYLQDTD